jgi:hypothetical protein
MFVRFNSDYDTYVSRRPGKTRSAATSSTGMDPGVAPSAPRPRNTTVTFLRGSHQGAYLEAEAPGEAWYCLIFLS